MAHYPKLLTYLLPIVYFCFVYIWFLHVFICKHCRLAMQLPISSVLLVVLYITMNVADSKLNRPRGVSIVSKFFT